MVFILISARLGQPMIFMLKSIRFLIHEQTTHSSMKYILRMDVSLIMKISYVVCNTR